ncbi:helix-turn-helix domain-containing protein [Streptomyces sp. NPDC086182]|uniref:helix-turn-helix domain-containing protein n=1 Tax=Streptomyces sp. NPDC086182 TaxID=3155058 RepID=UPI003418E6A1
MPDPRHAGKEGERVSDRTFQVLGAIRELGDGPHALRAIVGRTALSRSTVQRHILSGLRYGFIRQRSVATAFPAGRAALPVKLADSSAAASSRLLCPEQGPEHSPRKGLGVRLPGFCG